MLKKDARELYRKKRSALSALERLKFDDLLLIQFQKINLPFVSVVLSFYPIEGYNEIDTFHLTRYLQFINPGLHVAYPKTNFATNTMDAIICNEDDVFQNNAWDIPEPVKCEALNPSEIDLILLPLLAFDQQGNRVGYGKGFYDRFLEKCKDDCIRVGLSYFDALPVIEDANDFDVPLNYCITPQKAYVF